MGSSWYCLNDCAPEVSDTIELFYPINIQHGTDVLQKLKLGICPDNSINGGWVFKRLKRKEYYRFLFCTKDVLQTKSDEYSAVIRWGARTIEKPTKVK